MKYLIFCLMLILAPIIAQADEYSTPTGVAGYPVSVLERETIMTASIAATPTPGPVTHKMFYQHWGPVAWGDVLLGTIASFDTCQTSCKKGFLAGPQICNATGCYRYVEANHINTWLHCVNDNNPKFWINEICTVVFVGGAKASVLDPMLARMGPNWEKFDEYGTIAGDGAYAYTVIYADNNIHLATQHNCPANKPFWNPEPGSIGCF